tara:strand:- start:570 stop:815 length:246 start_codon:yes stop_codon:yes gene_type:complete
MKKNTGPKKFLFEKRNYRFLFLALFVISVGFILMTGGGSEDPNYFNEEIFNFQRIRIAPTLILIGFGIAMYSILTREISKK